MRFLGVVLLGLLAFCQNLSSQNTPANALEYTASRIAESPKIDGKIIDAAWLNAEFTSNPFTMQWPEVGPDCSEETQVALVYDDEAIYIAAKLYAENPDDILREFKPRDNGDANADFFAFFIDSYKSGGIALSK